MPFPALSDPKWEDGSPSAQRHSSRPRAPHSAPTPSPRRFRVPAGLSPLALTWVQVGGCCRLRRNGDPGWYCRAWWASRGLPQTPASRQHRNPRGAGPWEGRVSSPLPWATCQLRLCPHQPPSAWCRLGAPQISGSGLEAVRLQPACTVLTQFPEASAINSRLRMAASDLLFLVLSCASGGGGADSSWVWGQPPMVGSRGPLPWAPLLQYFGV